MRNRLMLNDINHVIADTLHTEKPTLALVAERLSTSTRSLQRKISFCDTTFSELVEAVRCARACKLLENRQIKIHDISQTLGYANPGSFTRAFERWMGVSPYRYRKQLNTYKIQTYKS